MMLARRAGLIALGAVLLSARPDFLSAQAPTVEEASTAMRAEPLPVLDAYGQVISEDLIRATMRDKGRRAYVYPLLGALVGTLVFTAATSPPYDCSIYDPCTPKEEFYKNGGPVMGLLVGTLVGFALPDGRVDRPTAVRILREGRQVEREGRVAP